MSKASTARSKAKRRVLTAPRMEGERISPAKRRAQWAGAFKKGGEAVLRNKKPGDHWGDDVADYCVRASFRNPDQFGIYLRDYNVAVATFSANSYHIRQALSRMMDAAHAVKASRDAEIARITRRAHG